MADTVNNVRLVSIIMQLGLNGGKAQAFMLEGPPGIGKTQGLEAMARMMEKRLGKAFPAEIWSGPQIQAEDAAGLPVPDLEEGTTRLLPLRIGEKVLPAGQGLLCIDEFGSITNSQEAAFLNLLQGGRLGERVLPSTIALGAMMNPEDHASNARGLSAPAANRFVWIKWDLSHHAWADFMLGGSGLSSYVEVLPDNWEAEYGRRARSLVVQYIRKHPNALLQMPQNHDCGKAWPSPRSWECAARLIAACLAVGERQTSDLVSLAVEGCVGPGQAQSFISWLTEMAIPDPEDLLKDPKNAPKLFPDRPDQLNVCLEAVAMAATNKEHKDYKDRWERAWAVIGPAFVKKQDVAFNGAKTLAQHIPPGAKYPPEVKMIPEILQAAGLKMAQPKK